ncbi:tRNA (34-2'-O)-methyltransferase regulator WDR6 [Discoglossus pictus]
MEIISELLVAPITALEFVGDHLLSGEGPNLTVYSLKHKPINTQRHRQNVLKGYAIHGITPCGSASDGLLSVFGSKGLIVLQLDISDQGVRIAEVCELHELHDWIWDTQWLCDKGQSAAYLGLALGHNSVALFDYLSGSVLKEVHCSEKCILYSAHFVGERWEDLMLVSGTVFNQLVIWSMADSTNDKRRVEPRNRISGHNGVIFSIYYEKQRGILASASDDRSLRVWNVGDLCSDVQCLLVLYGHQSRVWAVKLLPEKIISIGEDSACIVWNYNGDIIHNFKGHKGRGIRAVATQDQHGWVATGGADSGIRIWKLKENSAPSNGLLALNLERLNKKGTPKAIAMVDTNSLIVMTDMGSIFTHDFISKEWNLVLEDENYKSYSLLHALKLSCHVLCAIGNIDGSIKIFTLSSAASCINIRCHQGKIHSLTWVPSECQGSDTCSLFSSGPDGVMVGMEVRCISNGNILVTERGRFSLPICKQRWHTSIAFLPNEDLLVCGDRRGSLFLYSTKLTHGHPGEDIVPKPTILQVDSTQSITKEENHSAQQDPHFPISVLFGVHGKLGVTSVTCYDGFVYSTGRDGYYRQLKVEGGQLTILRKQKSCKGMEWIEQLSFTPDGNLLVLGFHSTDFVVWSTRTNEKLHCIPCGGGHRSWSFIDAMFTETFAYIKSGDIFVYQSEPMERIQSVLKESMHGREFTCVRHVGAIKGSHDEHLQVLVTSSEDTTVNILCFNDVTKQAWQLASINDHLSSVKTMAIAGARHSHQDCAGLSKVLFTAGGRAQIECYRLKFSQSKDAGSVSCQVIHLASHRLDEHWDRMKNKHRMVKMDPETRYMSVTVVGSDFDNTRPDSPCLFLAAACSDGSVRFFAMCERSRRLVLLAESFYHQRCVLKVESFVHRSSDGQRIFLCSAATDGSIAFWDITNTILHAYKVLEDDLAALQPCDLGPLCLTLRAHQCGINSLQIQETKDGGYLVASGGDDNSVQLSVVSVDRSVGVRLLHESSVPSSHAAHVTGLRVLRDDLLVTASVDQRLTLWRITATGLDHIRTKFCHVADVAALDFWETNEQEYLCVLCGQGLEVVRCVRAKSGQT